MKLSGGLVWDPVTRVSDDGYPAFTSASAKIIPGATRLLFRDVTTPPAAWACAYCGGMQLSDLYRCVSCGAPRGR